VQIVLFTVGITFLGTESLQRKISENNKERQCLKVQKNWLRKCARVWKSFLRLWTI